jgi:hypothetical protein
MSGLKNYDFLKIQPLLESDKVKSKVDTDLANHKKLKSIETT